MKLLSILIFLTLSAISIPTYAAELPTGGLKLAPYIQHLTSQVDGVTLEGARSSDQWVSLEGKTHLGNNQREHWFYIDLTPHTNRSQAQLLEFQFTATDEIDIYFYLNRSINQHHVSGDSIPFSSRPISNRKILFPIPHTEEGKLEIYIKTNSEGMTQIPIMLWNTRDFEAFDKFDTLWNGFYIGGIILIVLYHALLLIMLRKIEILAYILALLTIVSFRSVVWGYGLQYLWPENPELSNPLPPILGILSSITSLFFCYTFLSLSKRKGLPQIIVFLLVGLSIPALILCFFNPLTISVPVAILIGGVTLMTTFIISLYLWIKGVRSARYYWIADTPVFFGAGYFFLSLSGVVPVSFWSENVGALSILAYLCLLALAIADKEQYKQKEYNQNIQALNNQLEDRVEERTQELDNSLTELKDTQNQLIESEKMAALTSLVAGVAHEINTPLGVGVTAASSLKASSDRFTNNYSNNTLSRSEMDGYLEETKEALSLIENSFTRASQQIKAFKLITVEESNDDIHPFNIRENIESVLIILKSKLDPYSHNIHIDCDATLVVNSIQHHFTQLFANLILNSIQHAFEDQQPGNIYIAVHADNDTLTIDYKDDGKGLNQKKAESIFNPFNTTKRHDGHIGLGTTITYNTVTHALNGSISYSTQPNEGLAYHIEIPL